MTHKSGPYGWAVQDYSMAILHGGGDFMESAILDVSPCQACQNRAKDAGDPQWKWGRCTTPTADDAEFIKQALNMHAIALAAIAYTEEIMRGAENVAAWENLRDTVLAWKASQIEAAELADGVVKEIEVL